MKYLYLLALSVFLVSCGASNVENNLSDEVNQEIQWAMDSLGDENLEANTWEIQTFDAFYSNPATDVDMVISYVLDEDENIVSIEASATKTPNQVDRINQGLQELVGKKLSDGKEFQVAGASIASEAFRNALK